MIYSKSSLFKEYASQDLFKSISKIDLSRKKESSTNCPKEKAKPILLKRKKEANHDLFKRRSKTYLARKKEVEA